MKEKITEILNGLGIDGLDTEDITNQITKEVALHTVPKQTYNDLSKKFKNEEATRNSLESDLEIYKNKEEETTAKDAQILSLEKKIKEQGETIKNQILKSNKAQAMSILKSANIADDKVESLLDQIVSEDEDKTVKLATDFAEILKTTVNETKEKVNSDNLQDMAKPSIKSSTEKEITQEDFDKMSYSERKDLFLTDKDTFMKFSS